MCASALENIFVIYIYTYIYIYSKVNAMVSPQVQLSLRMFEQRLIDIVFAA